MKEFIEKWTALSKIDTAGFEFGITTANQGASIGAVMYEGLFSQYLSLFMKVFDLVPWSKSKKAILEESVKLYKHILNPEVYNYSMDKKSPIRFKVPKRRLDNTEEYYLRKLEEMHLSEL